MTEDEDPMFDPNELEEIALAMDKIEEEDGIGFEMVFWISNREAKDLIRLYDAYKENGDIGDPRRFIEQCMIIASCLKDAWIDEEE